MSNFIRCAPEVMVKCPYRIPCGGGDLAIYLEGSECDKFAQRVLKTPRTNADRIRAMTDEQLAEILKFLVSSEHCLNTYGQSCGKCVIRDICNLVPGDELAWLQQPVEEVDHG